MRTLLIMLGCLFGLSLNGQVIYADDIEMKIILNATWSPDGEFVSYVASDGIYLVDKNGGNSRLLSPPTGFGGWTTDSSGVFIIKTKNPIESTFEWWIYPVDGTDPVQFLPQLGSINTVKFSNNGEQVAVSAQATSSDPYQIWVGNADGSQLRPLAEYQAFELGWSSGDTQIIFETLQDDTGNTLI